MFWHSLPFIQILIKLNEVFTFFFRKPLGFKPYYVFAMEISPPAI